MLSSCNFHCAGPPTAPPHPPTYPHFPSTASVLVAANLRCRDKGAPQFDMNQQHYYIGNTLYYTTLYNPTSSTILAVQHCQMKPMLNVQLFQIYCLIFATRRSLILSLIFATLAQWYHRREQKCKVKLPLFLIHIHINQFRDLKCESYFRFWLNL